MTANYDEIRKLIERRYRRRILFGLHFTAFMVALVATLSWITTHWVYPGDWQNIWYLVGWGVLLFMHWGYFRLASARDREIETAWMRFNGDSMTEKAKPEFNEWRGLTNEDELIDWTDEPIPVREKPKRRG